MADTQKPHGMKWDEMNILATYHPPDKDYGHMRVDEPPTPYHYMDGSEDEDEKASREISGAELHKRLAGGGGGEGVGGGGGKPKILERLEHEDSEEEEDEEETPEQRQKRLEFESRRKAHYNEFHAVKLAKELLAQEEEDEEEDEDRQENKDQ